MNLDKNIVLIGMMGSGKSTVGKLLAERMGFGFIDTDARLEDWTGRKISEIFATDGEEEFRRLETEVVQQVAKRTGQIIATGGGVVLRSENVKALREKGIVVFLDAGLEILFQRLMDDDSRPLLQTDDPKKKLEDILKNRLPLYREAADIEIDTNLLNTEQVVSRIIHNNEEKKMEKKITINLKERSYPIFIGENNLDRLGELIKLQIPDARRVFVISNTTVEPLYAKKVLESLENADLASAMGVIPDGEEYKTLEIVSGLYDQLVDHNMDRSSVVVSLGGGVVGDLAGFVAATYMRGIHFVQVPTTLLAQVDSSIGGKVAVNHPAGKNLIGAFHQPRLVLIDISTLQTLARDELIAGMAEIIKHGMILDANYFNWIEENLEQILNLDSATLIRLIYDSCTIKGKIVEEDEKEQNIRAILNFGHTVGHGIEAVTHYKKYRHGEAVAIGMVQASRLAENMGLIDKMEVRRLARMLERTGLPIYIPVEINLDKIVKAIQNDKKAFQGKVKMILPTRIGQVKITDQWGEDDLLNILRTFQIV
ncbi:MAG: 3-dehydroquinate synthase [Halanaerobiales bacterium]|nr:3-dehydroquinate synthase [Halanaerobiales bacterium]